MARPVTTQDQPSGTLVEPDTRRRISLAQLGVPLADRYLAHTAVDGTITLTPCVVLTQTEYDLLAEPERLAALQAAYRRAETGQGGTSIAALATELGVDLS